MNAIKLRQNDPIIQRAMALDTSVWTEIGFIPGDHYGCKIHAKNKNGMLRILGIHSRVYGCKIDPITVRVEVLPDRVRRPA